MKRIKAACIVQTLHFMLKDGETEEFAKRLVQEEITRYKANLEKSRTKYRILSEEKQADGSVIMEIKKQYNTSPVGNYLN